MCWTLVKWDRYCIGMYRNITEYLSIPYIPRPFFLADTWRSGWVGDIVHNLLNFFTLSPVWLIIFLIKIILKTDLCKHVRTHMVEDLSVSHFFFSHHYGNFVTSHCIHLIISHSPCLDQILYESIKETSHYWTEVSESKIQRYFILLMFYILKGSIQTSAVNSSHRNFWGGGRHLRDRYPLKYA